MMEEYNHQISYRADPLPIRKIIYVVNSRKEATMKITRGDNPLNLIVHLNFRLKTLGSSEWLESKRLGLPPPPKLATFRLTVEEKKRKRTEFIKEVFLTGDVRVDVMDRNLIPPPGFMPIQGPVINEHESRIFFMTGNTEIGFQREKVMKGLSECKASESNIRRIQVKDIIKEVEDHLKTYSLAEMDISWMGKVLFDPNGGRCGGNGGRSGSMMVRGGGWLAKRSIVSNEGCGSGGLAVRGGEFCLEGCDGAGRGEVNGGRVVLGVFKR
ncbi:hypothetical protein Tco_0254938 [Tanacetum coccineum]